MTSSPVYCIHFKRHELLNNSRVRDKFTLTSFSSTLRNNSAHSVSFSDRASSTYQPIRKHLRTKSSRCNDHRSKLRGINVPVMYEPYSNFESIPSTPKGLTSNSRTLFESIKHPAARYQLLGKISSQRRIIQLQQPIERISENINTIITWQQD